MEVQRIGRDQSDAEKAQAARDEAVALAEAVHALRRLGSSEARKRLDMYQAFIDGTSVATVRMARSTAILCSFNPYWWVLTFTDLFYRGDMVQPKWVASSLGEDASAASRFCWLVSE